MNVRKKKSNNYLVFFLVLINILFFFSIAVNWYSANEIKKNFNNFSDQIGKNLQSLSREANNLNKELGGIQEKLGGLTNTVDELGNVEKELGVSNNNLGELRESLDEISQISGEKLTDLTKVGEEIRINLESVTKIKDELNKLTKLGDDLTKTGSDIKGSLDNVAEIKNELNKLTNLGTDLGDLTKVVTNLGEAINSEEVNKIKEEVNNLVNAMGSFDSIICSSCQCLKVSSWIRDSFIPEEKWKKLFRDGKIVFDIEIEEKEYWRDANSWFNYVPTGPETKEINETLKTTLNIDSPIIEKIRDDKCQYFWPPEMEGKTWSKVPRDTAKKLTLKKKETCHKCLKKINLENIKEYYKDKQKLIELFNV